MDEETIILRDMIEKRPCRIDMERRNQLVARFGHPEAFTRDGLKDEYIIDYATGIRTRRTLEECIIWKFDPQGALLDELKTLCTYPTPEPEPVKAIVVGVDELVKTEIRSSFAAWFKGLIPAFAHKRKVYGKRPDISLERAAELAGITVDQLRTIEGLPKRKQMGYPGRNGDNLDFLEASLQLWGQKYRSAKKADKRIKKGLSNPVHHPTL